MGLYASASVVLCVVDINGAHYAQSSAYHNSSSRRDCESITSVVTNRDTPFKYSVLAP